MWMEYSFLVASVTVIAITIFLHAGKPTPSQTSLLEAVGMWAFAWVLIGLVLDILIFLMG